MSLNEAYHCLPDGFANVVRLFPLPNVVLFPGVVQALHLFEPRYRMLMTDALAADELITMAFLRPDWEQTEGLEPDGSGRVPEIAKTVCIGKILSHTELEDGRFNLFLVGTRRARITKELDLKKPYRMAEIEIVDDFVDKSEALKGLRQAIILEFRNLVRLRPSWNHEALDQFLGDDLPFGQLVDMICYSCGADPNQQFEVLETSDLQRRGEIVLRLLQSQVNAKSSPQDASQNIQDFPPGFSMN